MARARNIKPGFFTNEDIAELDFATRLLFIALWTLADRKGRLEDRPKKIKMAAFPADNLDIDQMLHSLSTAGLIERYSVGEQKLIQIPQFEKHQSPHHREPASILPPPGSEPGQAPVRPPASRSDTGFSDTGFSDSDGTEFEQVWQAYPKRAGGNSKADAQQAWVARRREGHSAETILAGVERYAAFCKATGKLKTEFVKQAKTFLGRGLHFLEDWNIPENPNGTDRKLSPVERVQQRNREKYGHTQG